MKDHQSEAHGLHFSSLLANQSTLQDRSHSPIHSHTNGTAFGSNSGLSFLPKDTLTWGLELPRFKPLIFRLVDEPL